LFPLLIEELEAEAFAVEEAGLDGAVLDVEQTGETDAP